MDYTKSKGYNNKMTEEVQDISNEEKIAKLEEYIKSITFFSDQVSFNATIHQALKLILQKLVNIEEKLEKKQDGSQI